MSVEEDVVGRVRDADPARGLAADPVMLRELLQNAVTTPVAEPVPESRRRHRTTLLAGGLAGVLALGFGAPAIAGELVAFLARTGWVGISPNPGPQPVNDGTNTESDDSEWVSVLAPDFVDYAVSIFPDYITVPSTYDRGRFAVAVPTRFQQGAQQQAARDGSPGAVIQETSVLRNYESAAQCAWMQEWLDADTVADESRRQGAAIVLRADATWPATVATDGGGIVDSYLVIADAADAGDRGPVQKEVDINCGPSYDEAKN